MPACTRFHKHNMDTYLKQKKIQPKHYQRLLTDYVQHICENKIECIQQQCALNSIRSVEKVFTIVKPFLTKHPESSSQALIHISVIQQFEKIINHYKEYCCEQIAKQNNTQRQLQIVVSSCSSNTLTSIHPRGCILSLMLMCCISLVSLEMFSIQNQPHTRTNQEWIHKLFMMKHTLYKHLKRFIWYDFSTDYDAEMKTCFEITQQPLTNTYQYGWYHADLAPYILSHVPCHVHHQPLHDVASMLMHILNNDKSYANTKTKKHAYSFMASQCKHIWKTLV